jgi:hypothetical protein
MSKSARRSKRSWERAKKVQQGAWGHAQAGRRMEIPWANGGRGQRVGGGDRTRAGELGRWTRAGLRLVLPAFSASGCTRPW